MTDRSDTLAALPTGCAPWLSVGEFGRARWDRDAEPESMQHSQRFLEFRGFAERSRYGLMTDRDGGPIRAAMPLYTTDTHTGLFSDPWKLLAAEQFLRLDGTEPAADADSVRARHADLLAAVGGSADIPTGGPAGSLRRAVGAAAVSRFFDESDVLVDPGLDEPARCAAIDAVLTRAQDSVRSLGLGALVLPYVAPENARLRGRLRTHGFVGGVITGRSVIEVPPGLSGLREWVATRSKSTRRRFRQEQQRFGELSMSISSLPTDPQTLQRITQLEVNTLARHGGRADADALARLRAFQAESWREKFRLTGVVGEAGILACSVDLVGRQDFYGLTYGRRYDLPGLEPVYPQLCYWAPIGYCIEAGIRELHYGFEAFEPKALRGGQLAGLQLWLWTPDAERTARFGRLLSFLDRRARAYLDRWSATLPEDG